MPFSASSSLCRRSSVHRELPPSMTMSPSLSSPLSSSTVARVGSPAGTITQTTFGEGSASTMARRLSTSLTSGLRS
jgi:hypothetical protein